MNAMINVLILLAGVTFILAVGVGYGLLLQVFPPASFVKFSLACLAFAVTLILLQIRDKK